ncbi:MAG: 50S ribosomal protein L17 [Candidatus Omnitrophica bacterium]|nr:50S ribosomal protein L17 [Candidatus Omnitrophota bacterium]
MRHSKKKHQLNRYTSWHRATMVSMARNMLIYQSMHTTLARAKAARPLVEKLVSLAKANTLAAKRDAFQILGDHKLVSALFKDIGPLFAKRQSGFTRTIGLGKRRGDNAEIVIFELTEKIIKEPKKHKKEKPAKPAEEATETTAQEQKAVAHPETKEKPPIEKKPSKKFLGGLKNIFKKERRDSGS